MISKVNSLKKSVKLIKPELDWSRKKRRYKLSTSQIKWVISLDTRDIKRLIREYYEQLQANKLNKLLILKARKIDWIKKVENLKSFISVKEIGFLYLKISLN